MTHQISDKAVVFISPLHPLEMTQSLWYFTSTINNWLSLIN